MNRVVAFDKDEKIWSGPKFQPIYNPNVSVGYLILNVLKKTPEMVTQVSADTGVEITCHEMRRRTIKIAKNLQAEGYKQGDIVGIMASNSENLAPLVFACFTLGLPISPVAPAMQEADIVMIYSMTKPKIIFCDATVVKIVQSAVDKMSIKPVINTLIDKISGYSFLDDILTVGDNKTDDFK